MTYAVLEREIMGLPEIYFDRVAEYIKSLKKEIATASAKQSKKALFDCIGIDIDATAIIELREQSKL